MKLLVVVLCLLSERYLTHSLSTSRFKWFPGYFQKIFGFTKSVENPWLLLAVTVLPILIVTMVVYYSLQHIVFGLAGLVLSIIIFIYCLGPQNPFYPITTSSEQGANVQVGNYFAVVNSQLFAVIFWYVVAGPVAALAYRLVHLCIGAEPIQKQAMQVADVLEWLPARITALLYLLVGNFQSGMTSFVHFITSKPNLNSDLLSECGLKAISAKDDTEIPMSCAESLVEHATIVLLVVIALCTLGSWM